MAITAAELLVNVRADVDKAKRDLDTLNRRVDDMRKVTGPAATAAKGFGLAAVAGFGVLGSQAVLGGVTFLTAAITPLVGAMAALPAAGAGLAGVFGALKVGTLGWGDAMDSVFGTAEEFQAGIAGLAPAAAETATAIRGLEEGLFGVREATQQALFSGLAQEVQDLGSAYLPVMQARLSEIAGELSLTARSTSDFLTQASTVGDVNSLLATTRTAAIGITEALPAVVEGFLALATGGQAALVGLGGGLGDMAQRFRDWAVQARDSGQVMEWITNAKDAASDLWGVIKNLAGALGAVFDAARISGGGFLGTLETLTGNLRTFLESAQGQTALISFFDGAQRAASALWPVIEQVLGVVGELAPVLANIAEGVGPGLTAFFAALQPVIASLAPVATQIGVAMGEFLVSLIPLLPLLATTVQVFASMLAVVAPFGPVLLGLLGSFMALNAAVGVVNAVGSSVQAAATAFSLLKTGGSAIGSLVAAMGRYVAQAVVFVAQTLATVAVTVAQWVLMGAQAMIQAARMAAAWFIALGPVGWVIATVIALVALIIANWDTVKRVTMQVFSAIGDFLKRTWDAIKAAVSATVAALGAAISAAWNAIKAAVTAVVNAIKTTVESVWNAIKGAVTAVLSAMQGAISAAWNAIKGVITAALSGIQAAMSGAWGAIRGAVSGAWEGIKGAVSGAISGLLGIVRALPGQIVSALGNLSGLLVGAGKSIIQGLINGIKSMAGAVTGAVKGVLSAARDLLPFSPAKEGPFSGKGWTLYSGRSISESLADGISDNLRAVRSNARALADAAVPPLGGPLGGSARLAGVPTAGNRSTSVTVAPGAIVLEVQGGVTPDAVGPLADSMRDLLGELVSEIKAGVA